MKLFKLVISSLLIIQALFIGVFAFNVETGNFPVNINNEYFFSGLNSRLCSELSLPDFSSFQLNSLSGDPAGPSCGLNLWIIIPSIAAGVFGAYSIYKISFKKKAKQTK